MKRLLVLGMILAASLGLVFPVHAQEVKVVFATGSAEGAYHLLGASMAKVWNSRIPGMNVTARTTDNPAENAKLVKQKGSRPCAGAEQYSRSGLQRKGSVQGKTH